jgi:hypothetical protein
MERDYKKEIEEIIDGLSCPKDFKCCQSGYERLCQARRSDDGAVSYLECLERTPQDCVFSKYLSMGDFYVCSCPLRIYLASKLKK